MHDLVFVVGDSITECFPKIKAKWFGDIESVHIDSYAELTQIEGYTIELAPDKKSTLPSLYFVNLGFAESTTFGEGHLMTFLAADSKEEATIKAKTMFPKDSTGHHVDNLLKITNIDSCYITLVPNPQAKSFKFTNVYWKL